MLSNGSELSDHDFVLIDHDEVSNSNSAQLLPEAPHTISNIRMWLQPTAYDLDHGEYRKHQSKYLPGTGVWLTSSETYQEWLHSEEIGMLWIRGIPGSGKSVMASKLIDDLSQSQPGVPVLYFFFRQTIAANYEPVALLRDWLDQVILFSPPLQKRLKTHLFDVFGWTKQSAGKRTIEDFWEDLRVALSGLPGRVYCIVDALDEMSQGNDRFLEALAALGSWKPDKVKVLVTSRPLARLEGPLQKAKTLQIRLDGDMVNIDISKYARHALTTSPITPSNQKLIEEAVRGRASGQFLYAKFALDAYLEAGADANEVLKQLPEDLNALYTDLLREHARRSGAPDDIQLLILQWVTHATRPLRLLEIAEIINVTNKSEVERDLKATKNLVRLACGPFLEVLPDETVCVVHHSFTEYLKGSTRPNRPSGYPIIDYGRTHGRLALACLAYLQSGCLDETSRDNSRHGLLDGGGYHSHLHPPWEESPLCQKYPFLKYAATNWFTHVERSAAAEDQHADVNSALDRCFENRQRLNTCLNIAWPLERMTKECPGMRATPLHVAAYTGLSLYVKHLLDFGSVDVDAEDAMGRTALWWAASCGNTEIISLLLNAGADPDKDDSESGLKPLHVVAKNNHFQAAKLLLEAGVYPLTEKTKEDIGNFCGNAPRTVGHTPLMYACHAGHLETVEVFLPFLKDIDIVHRALAWAIRESRSELVELILRHPGVNVNAKVRGDTPLFLACCVGDTKSIALLINAGADPNIPCNKSRDEFAGIPLTFPRPRSHDTSRGFMALHSLCSMEARSSSRDWDIDGLQSAIRLIVRAGADINQRDAYGETPLFKAISDPILVRLLFDEGADANAEADDGSVPLHHVISTDSMCLLIEHGRADLNKRQADGRTPLLCMLHTAGTDVVSKFLEYKPDCNAVDKNGNGVLHAHLLGRHASASTMKALLKMGADPNLKNRFGRTPMHVLVQCHENMHEMLDILLEAGADINA